MRVVIPGQRWCVVTDTAYVSNGAGRVAWTYDLVEAARVAHAVGGRVISADEFRETYCNDGAPAVHAPDDTEPR